MTYAADCRSELGGIEWLDDPARSARRTRASYGLTIQPVAPAARARAFFSSELSVDRTRIGRSRWRPSERRASIRPKPSMRGMLMSVMIMSGVLTFRSEEHTSELQSLMRISYAVFCLKKKKTKNTNTKNYYTTAHNET